MRVLLCAIGGTRPEPHSRVSLEAIASPEAIRSAGTAVEISSEVSARRGRYARFQPK